MREHDSAITASGETLLDLTALRADTPGSESVIHFNNAGCGLLARPVHQAMVEHLDLEARIGGYEAADVRAAEVSDFYAATAELIGSQPSEIAFAASATDAYTGRCRPSRSSPVTSSSPPATTSSPTRSPSCRYASGSASRSCTHPTTMTAAALTSTRWRSSCEHGVRAWSR